MKTYDLIVSRRSIRRFKNLPVPREILVQAVDSARLAPSAANMQPLEYIVVDDEENRKKIFPGLRWAGYIRPEGDPPSGKEPAAYIIVIVNTNVKQDQYQWDVGAAVENMILTALEHGVGSCWLVSIDRDSLRKILRIPAEYAIDSVLALGYPDEAPVVEAMSDSVEYWKDKKGCLHVPKRRLEKILHVNRFNINNT